MVSEEIYNDWKFIKPFVPNAPFLYPLKSSENRKVFRCFQGAEKGCIGNEWVKHAMCLHEVLEVMWPINVPLIVILFLWIDKISHRHFGNFISPNI